MKSRSDYLAIFDNLDQTTTGISVIALVLTLLGFIGDSYHSPLGYYKPLLGIIGLIVLCGSFLHFAIQTRKLIVELTSQIDQVNHHDQAE